MPLLLRALDACASVLSAGRLTLPDAAQFGLGRLLAGVYQECGVEDAAIDAAIARMLASLDSPMLDVARKQGALARVVDRERGRGRCVGALGGCSRVWELLTPGSRPGAGRHSKTLSRFETHAAILTVLSFMASSSRVLAGLERMQAGPCLLQYGHASPDVRLRARALSLAKVFMRNV